MEYQTYQNEKRLFRILSLAVDQGACGWMRVRQPFKIMNEQKLADCQVLEGVSYSEEMLKKLVMSADVILFKTGTEELAREMKRYAPMKKFVFDLDDDMFNILPSSDAYRKYGTEDVVVSSGGQEVWLWKHGRDGFDKFSNKRRLVNIEEGLNIADAVVCVTDRLSEYIAQISGRDVYTVPNSIDLRLYPDIEVRDPKKGDEFRIGFCGGASHYGDLNMIAPQLTKLIKSNPNIIFYIIGQKFDMFKEVENQVRYERWLPFEANPYRMRLLDLDLLIAPLQDLPFNNRKDPLKFWDAAGLSLPLMASNVAPFSDVIEHGVTGYLFNDAKDMCKQIKRLISKPKELHKVGRNARKWVEKNRNAHIIVPQYLNLLKKIWKPEIFSQNTKTE